MTQIQSQILMIGLTLMMVLIFVSTADLATQELILSGVAVGIILLSLVLERKFPYKKRWNTSDNDGLGDLISLGFILAAVEPAMKWFFPVMLLWVIGDTNGFVGQFSLALQISLVFFVVELGAYISHWLHHNTNILWQFHAVHHSPTRLYTMNNFRFHPLNYLLNGFATVLPALAIGATPLAILGYVAISYPIILFQHSNIQFQFGWLNYVLNTNEVHRWHHSTAPSEGASNYGRALVIWDQIFGTFILPGGAPANIGLFRASRYFPKTSNYFAQLFYPFSRNCCQ